MEDIDFKLTAKNSSGEQALTLVKNEGGFWFVLTGNYKGEPIQIDFDEMTREELEDLSVAIHLILDAP